MMWIDLMNMYLACFAYLLCEIDVAPELPWHD